MMAVGVQVYVNEEAERKVAGKAESSVHSTVNGLVYPPTTLRSAMTGHGLVSPIER